VARARARLFARKKKGSVREKIPREKNFSRVRKNRTLKNAHARSVDLEIVRTCTVFQFN